MNPVASPPGSDRVHSYAAIVELFRERFGERDQGALRGGVRTNIPVRACPADPGASEVDDRATSGRDQLGNERRGDGDGAHDVDVERVAPRLEVELIERADRAEDPGIVHHGAARTDLVGDPSRERSDPRCVDDVDGFGDDGDTEHVVKFGCELLQIRRGSCTHRHVVTELGEVPGERGAEPAAGAGDNNGPCRGSHAGIPTER